MTDELLRRRPERWPGPAGRVTDETAGVAAARRRLRDESRRSAWQALLVLSGLWREATYELERFTTDSAADFERRSIRLPLWGGRLVADSYGLLARVLRRSAERTRAWRRSAAAADDVLRRHRAATTRDGISRL